MDINKWKLLEDDLKRYIYLQNYDLNFVKQIFDYIIVLLYLVMPPIGRSATN